MVGKPCAVGRHYFSPRRRASWAPADCGNMFLALRRAPQAAIAALLSQHVIVRRNGVALLKAATSSCTRREKAHHAWASAIGTTNPHMVAKALTKGFQIACLKHMTKSNQQIQHKNIETRSKQHVEIDFNKSNTKFIETRNK